MWNADRVWSVVYNRGHGDFATAAKANGWKFHIGFNDDVSNPDEFLGKPKNYSNNFENAWEIASTILIDNGINLFKVMRPGVKPTNAVDMSQASKQIVVYVDQNPDKSTEDWQKILTEIELSFIENKITPRESLGGKTERQVNGSQYFTYRNSASSADKVQSSYKRTGLCDNYNNTGEEDPFKSMTIDVLKPKGLVIK